MGSNLQVTEIYESVQGESRWAGLPCSFIRLTGCPLRCRWCDTVYGFHGGESLSIREVVDRVLGFKSRLVELTGGEPMAQENTVGLMKSLHQEGFEILMETGGSIPLSRVPSYVNIIMDIKCPGSGMEKHNHFENIKALKPTDEIKFVIAGFPDFQWALEIIHEFHLDRVCHLAFSPAFGLVKPEHLVKWMLDAGVKARLNLQLHKYIWDPRSRGV